MERENETTREAKKRRRGGALGKISVSVQTQERRLKFIFSLFFSRVSQVVWNVETRTFRKLATKLFANFLVGLVLIRTQFSISQPYISPDRVTTVSREFSLPRLREFQGEYATTFQLPTTSPARLHLTRPSSRPPQAACWTRFSLIWRHEFVFTSRILREGRTSLVSRQGERLAIWTCIDQSYRRGSSQVWLYR